MSEDKRAKTVEEAAYVHLQVYRQSVEAWPEELKERLPAFSELYVPTAGGQRQPGALERLLNQVRKTPGPVKLLLTGQRGAGKSWMMRHIGDALASEFVVVRVSATDHSGTTLADADASDVLVLLCQALSARMTGWQRLADADLALTRWVRQFDGMRGLPTVPDKTESFDVEINTLFAKFASRMRADQEVRDRVRAASTDDLLIVANAMLKVIGKDKPVLVLFDDLDKIDGEWAKKLFGPQFSTIAKLQARMILTLPFSVTFENVAAVRPEVLRNIQVQKSATEPRVLDEALARFTQLLEPLLAPDLIDGAAVEVAVRYSGGIIREFGRIIAEAFETAALQGEARVGVEQALSAVREARIVLERASSDGARRESLKSVRQTREIRTEMDRRLLNENMIV